MVTVLVVDDHAVVRKGLKQVLAEEFSDATIIEIGTGQGALEAVCSKKIDAIVLDLNLPDKHGLEILKEIKSTKPDLPVIVLSLYSEEQYGFRVLRAGGSGFLNKETAPEELVSALKKVLMGGTYVTPSLAEHLASGLSIKSPTALYQTLSDRELEVLCLIAKGKTATQISDELSLSVKTISTYRSRLLEKLKRDTTAELIRYAVDHHLVE